MIARIEHSGATMFKRCRHARYRTVSCGDYLRGFRRLQMRVPSSKEEAGRNVQSRSLMENRFGD